MLEDKYGLYKNYPKNWLMNKQYDGNVTTINNQGYWKMILCNSVHFYTSDLGFEKGFDNNYNSQEYYHVKPNIGQILTGLLVLKKGGSMVTK